jgi:hypothetical protein
MIEVGRAVLSTCHVKIIWIFPESRDLHFKQKNNKILFTPKGVMNKYNEAATLRV